MVKSMTGYGRRTARTNGKDITVEIKSVNSRYLDYSAKVPRLYGFLEEKLKTCVAAAISRGKVDVFVTINIAEGPLTEVQVNHSYLKSYLEALKGICSQYDVKDDITVSLLAKNQELFNVVKKEEDIEEVWKDVEPVAAEAIRIYTAMRTAEGEKLCEDLKERAASVEKMTYKIEELSAGALAEYRVKLEQRVKELIGDVTVDESRLLSETAIYADRISVTEELVRLRSHIFQFHKMLDESVPIGKKMDFLIQEMNREINTTGSKANSAAIARIVVDAKSEIEKIREQIQNIE